MKLKVKNALISVSNKQSLVSLLKTLKKFHINIISSGGENLELSSKRIVNYQNENMDLCVFHEIQEELKPGSYKVEIFNDGYFIGESSFALR